MLATITLVINFLAERRNGYFDSKVYYGAIQYWFRGDGGMVYDWLRPGTQSRRRATSISASQF